MEQPLNEHYFLNRDTVDSLMNQYFELTNEENTWGKDRLTSVKLLSEVFNNYIDLAQETMNFTELDNLSKESQENFEKSLLKNLLFILRIIQNKNLPLTKLLKSLER